MQYLDHHCPIYCIECRRVQAATGTQAPKRLKSMCYDHMPPQRRKLCLRPPERDHPITFDTCGREFYAGPAPQWLSQHHLPLPPGELLLFRIHSNCMVSTATPLRYTMRPAMPGTKHSSLAAVKTNDCFASAAQVRALVECRHCTIHVRRHNSTRAKQAWLQENALERQPARKPAGYTSQ